MSGIMAMVLGARTAIAAAVDEFFNRVTLLLPGDGTNGAQNNTFLDSSSNNFTITRNGNTTQGTFSPFSQTGWSNYFNGATTSGPLLSASYSTTNFDWFTSGQDFTLECWVFPVDLATFSYSDSTNIVPRMTGNNDQNGTSNYWSFGPISDGRVRLHYFNGAVVQVTSTSTVTANTWNHIAFTKTSSGITIFVNGTATTATAISGTPQSSATYPLTIGRGNSGSINGYVSNYRILKNVTPPYSGSYTVPTSPLTDISGTKILTAQANRFVDSSSVANVMTVTGSTVSVQAFSPFAPTAAYSAATVGGSGYFDGSGDYLSVSDNAAFDFGNGDFTIELWAYMTGAAQQFFVSQWNSPQRAWAFLVKNSGATLSFVYSTTGSNEVQIDGSITAPVNAWAHFAVVRNGNTVKTYMNGVEIGSGSVTGVTLFNASQAIEVGRNSESTSTWNFTGYVAGLRILKGTAQYTAAFAPPTSPPTAITNTSLLLNYTNAGITDATAKNDLETVGNAQISTTQSKFGGSSIYLDGTGDYLTLPTTNQSLTLGSANWTIEFWIYLPSLPNTRKEILYLNGNTSGYAAVALHICSNNKLGLSFSESGSGWRADDTTGVGTALSATTWQYVAVTRNGQNIQIYLDGAAQGSAYTTTASTTSLMTTYTLNQIGTYNTSSYQLNAYIDDLRITLGQVRTVTTSPTAAFPLQ